MKDALIALCGAAAAVVVPLAPVASAEPADGSAWVADLSVVDGDDSNVVIVGGVVRIAGSAVSLASAGRAEPVGMLVLAPRALDRPANRVGARVRGSVPPGAELAVDVRGIRANGSWTEWIEARPYAPAELPELTGTSSQSLSNAPPNTATPGREWCSHPTA